MQVFLPSDEAERVKALTRYEFLKTTPTHELDDLTFLAAQICQTPVALITFVGADRQWFQAVTGCTMTALTQADPFCAYTIQQNDLLIVPDARVDARFATSPLVVGEPYTCFYAGVPLVTPDGYVLGALCVIDQVPRSLTPTQQQALRALGRQVIAQLEARRHISERQRAEEGLRKAHELYRRAITSADAVPYERDYSTDSFVFMGEAILQITGYTAAEMTPALLDEICEEVIMRGEAEGLSEAEAIYRTRLGELHRWRCDSRIRTRTGEARWIADSSIEIYDAQNKPIGSIGILMDITERMETEIEVQETNRRLAETLAELQRTQQQLIQQERLRAVGTMASGIAHDFNNLLSPIVSFTELLLLRPESRQNEAKFKHYLRAIYTAAQGATTVVRRLREFYRLPDDAEPQVAVDLAQVVEQAILLTQPHWKDQALANGLPVRIETDLQPVPLILGNPAELQEMITNLLLNAVDALKTEGKVTLRVVLEPTVDTPLSSTPTPARVLLEVSDTGIGMDEETRQRCFEPFFSTKGKQGTGLGLAIVYGIVQRHQGAIEVKSGVGQGTTFRIHLPVPAEQPTISPPHRRQATRPLHVLVVDDDPTVRDVMVAYLQHERHSTTTASNGVEGLEKFRTEQFDLVMTDRSMPVLNGDGLAAAIKQMGSATPIVLVTGFGDFMNASGELPKGVDYVMSKPFTLNMLQQTIARAVATTEKTN